MHTFKIKILAAVWAFKHPDYLTMLKHELLTDMASKNSHGRDTAQSYKAAWLYNRYLSSLPIS